MKKIITISLFFAIFALFSLSSCKKAKIQENFVLKEEGQDSTGQFSKWLEQNTVVIDSNYTEDGVQGVLYEVHSTHQRIFIPNKNNTKFAHHDGYLIGGSFSHELSMSQDNNDISCEGSGNCCEVYTTQDGGAVIRVNPLCFRVH